MPFTHPMTLQNPSFQSCLQHRFPRTALPPTVRSTRRASNRWHSTQRCSSSAYSNGNLGVLASELQTSTGDESWALQRVSAESLRDQGLYFDTATIVTSSVVLLLLLAVSFQRVLGLDRFINEALRNWKERREEERRKEIMDARQSLLKGWADDGGEAGGGPGPKP